MNSSVLYNGIATVGDMRFTVSIDRSFFEAVPWPVTLHNHAFYEVHIVKQGACIFEIDGRELILEGGSYCIIGPTVYHARGNALTENTRRYCFKFEAVASAGAPETAFCLPKAGFFRVFDHCARQTQLVEELIVELQDQRPYFTTGANSLLSLLILSIFRDLSDEPMGESRYKNVTIDENRAVAIDEFFAQNYRNPEVRVSELAAQLNLSIRQLDRIMQRYYGVSFKQKLTEMRIIAAKDLLHGPGPVQLVSEAVGYASLRCFQTAFQRETGMTPEQWRKH